MSQDFQEGTLSFKFPNGWRICRAEHSKYYGSFFQNFCSTIRHTPGCPVKSGSKEMDFAAYDPVAATLWLIEVKDFRLGPWTKPLDLIDQIALKTRDTLALISAAAIVDMEPNSPPLHNQGQNWQAGEFGRSLQGAMKLKVVLHCELQPAESTLFPNLSHAANLAMKLKQMLRHVDSAPLFANRVILAHTLSWQVV